MKKLLGLLGFLMLVGLPTMAQDRPIADVGGGYEFRGWNLAFEPLLKMNGWFATGDFNFTNRIALAADVSGTYNHGGNGFANTTIYTYQFGPRIYLLGHHRISPFVHGLFGLSRGSASFEPPCPCAIPSDTGYTWDAGGGVDLAFRNRWALRLQGDYDQTQLFGGGPNQNNFKFGVGVVYRIGSK
jgi:opacity protein-like surface antigen